MEHTAQNKEELGCASHHLRSVTLSEWLNQRCPAPHHRQPDCCCPAILALVTARPGNGFFQWQCAVFCWNVGVKEWYSGAKSAISLQLLILDLLTYGLHFYSNFQLLFLFLQQLHISYLMTHWKWVNNSLKRRKHIYCFVKLIFCWKVKRWIHVILMGSRVKF